MATRKKRKTPGINGSSTSDISFLLLTFFLLTSNINTDMGLARRLPPPPVPNQELPQIHQRNIFVVLVNSMDALSVDGQLIDIRELKDRAKEFLDNPTDSPKLPEKEMQDIPLLGKVPVSKGVISLRNDRGTSYDMYIKVQNELTAAINELRDERAKTYFQRSYIDCLPDQREAIDKVVPIAISEAEPKNVGGNK